MRITFQNREIETVESWDRLPVNKQLAAYQIIMSNIGEAIDEVLELPFKRQALMQLITDISDNELNELYAICTNENALEGHFVFMNIIDDLCICTDFLFTTLENGQKTINPTLYMCPFPSFQGNENRPTLFAAGTAFDNINFYELTLIFDLYNQHTQSDDPSVVNELLATIYRPAKEATPYNLASGYEGDIRQPILHYETMVETRKVMIDLLPEDVKMLLCFWVACCIDGIVKRNKQLFDRRQDYVQKTRDYGWASVLLKLSGGVVHLDAVAQQPYENVLTYLNILEDERVQL